MGDLCIKNEERTEVPVEIWMVVTITERKYRFILADIRMTFNELVEEMFSNTVHVVSFLM